MVRPPASVIATFVSIALLSSGGYVAFLNVVWSVEWAYDVEVAAPATMTWTLWVPDPNVSMPWTATGSVAVVGTVNSTYGMRINITGTGTAEVRFSNSTSLVGLEPWGVIPALSLRGGEGAGSGIVYRIWRWSSDPSANLTLTGGLRLDARSPPESWTCVGSGFSGHPEEGWRAFPMTVGDCVRTFSERRRFLALTLIGLGSVLAGVSAAAWGRRPKAP